MLEIAETFVVLIFRLHHEIKDGRTETLNRTIALMDEYGLRAANIVAAVKKAIERK